MCSACTLQVEGSPQLIIKEELILLKKYKPKVVITALGSPAPVIDIVHAYGGVVIADVNSVELAKKAILAGADGLALVSFGAGGHTGHMNAYSFISEVRNFYNGFVKYSSSEKKWEDELISALESL